MTSECPSLLVFVLAAGAACSTSASGGPTPDASSVDGAGAASEDSGLSGDAAANDATSVPDAGEEAAAGDDGATLGGDASTDAPSSDEDAGSANAPGSLLGDGALGDADASAFDAAPEAAPYDGPTGAPDPTFGTAGEVTAAFPEDGGSFEQITSLALDPDAGTILVGGTALHADQTTWGAGVARFTAGGVPDTTFASTGVLVTDFGLSTQPVVGGLAVQPDHRTLVAGFGYASLTANSFYVARLDVAGTLDTTFGSAGLLSASPPAGSFDGAGPVLLDATGFYVAGWQGTGSESDFALWRYGTSAAPVASFGTAGRVTTTIEAGKGAHATVMARQSTQKILLDQGDPVVV